MRLLGWEAALIHQIELARHEPYVLGEHDCFSFACKVIGALTGKSRWDEFKGYKTKREALHRLAKYGKTFEDAGDWFFGKERVGVQWAQRGDILAYQDETGEKHAGVCIGSDTIFLSDKGIVTIPTLKCLCAWRVE
jgi:hypothetical protein